MLTVGFVDRFLQITEQLEAHAEVLARYGGVSGSPNRPLRSSDDAAPVVGTPKSLQNVVLTSTADTVVVASGVAGSGGVN